MNEFDDIGDLEDLWRSASSKPPIPEGNYVLRTDQFTLTRSRTETKGILVRFRIVEGPCANRTLFDTCWITEAAREYSRRVFDTIGLEGKSLREILNFRDFATLPLLQARVRVTDFEGSRRSEIERLWRAKLASDSNEIDRS